MPNWLKTYWPALLLALAMLAVMDGTVSSLLTCHPIAAATGQNAQQGWALVGPVLTTLTASVDFLDGHGEAVTAIFTIVLAAFTDF